VFSAISNVSKPGNIGPVFLEDFRAEAIYLHLNFRSKTSPFTGKAKASHARERINVNKFLH
jgi:hypothetical protein